MNSLQQIFSKVKGGNWIFVFYLFFVIYLIFDGIVYFANSYSGRISTLNCNYQVDQRTVCTVRIYGLGETYQHSFWADDFWKVIKQKKFIGSSDSLTCGASILTTSEQINFVHPYQKCSRIEQVVEQINQLFDGNRKFPSNRVIYIGFNTSLYRRVLLLVLGLLVVRYVYKSSWYRQENSIVENKKEYRKLWFWSNISVRLLYYVSNAFIIAIWAFSYPTEQSDFLRSCHFVFRYCDNCADFPFNYIFCLYPLIVILLLQALVQKLLLAKAKIDVSAWWIFTPVIASVPLMFMSPGLTCDGCGTLKYLMAGIIFDFNTPIIMSLGIYFFVMGFLQWLILRKKLTSSYAWIIMPLISSMLVVPVYMYLNSGFVESQVSILLIPIALIAGELITAAYISWLIYVKNNTLN